MRSKDTKDSFFGSQTYCDMVAALGDGSQKGALRGILMGKYPLEVRITSERALILLEGDSQPVLARRTMSARKFRHSTAWLKDQTTWLLFHRDRRSYEVDDNRHRWTQECRYAIRTLGDTGKPSDIALLLPLLDEHKNPLSPLACAAIIKIIRRHNLSGPYEAD